MNKIQKDYIEAKLAYEKAKGKWCEAVKSYNEQVNNNQISVDEWSKKVTDLEFKLGVPETNNRLVLAERRLIDWARRRLNQEITEEQGQILNTLWERWWYPNVKDKVIDICLKLKD